MWPGSLTVMKSSELVLYRDAKSDSSKYIFLNLWPLHMTSETEKYSKTVHTHYSTFFSIAMVVTSFSYGNSFSCV